MSEKQQAANDHFAFVIYGALGLVLMGAAGTLGGLPGLIVFALFFVMCAIFGRDAVRRAK